MIPLEFYLGGANLWYLWGNFGGMKNKSHAYYEAIFGNWQARNRVKFFLAGTRVEILARSETEVVFESDIIYSPHATCRFKDLPIEEMNEESNV